MSSSKIGFLQGLRNNKKFPRKFPIQVVQLLDFFLEFLDNFRVEKLNNQKARKFSNLQTKKLNIKTHYPKVPKLIKKIQFPHAHIQPNKNNFPVIATI
jgi:hypothetical protein